MKTRQVKVTHIMKGFAFGETTHGNKEQIFISFNNRAVVTKTKGGNPKLEESDKTPKYYLKKGDVIKAVIVDGNETRRKAGLWAPLSVWNGDDPVVCKVKEVKKNTSKKEVDSFDEEVNFLKEVDLPFLDEYRNRDITIRVRPPCGHGQIYYGPLGTLLSSKAKAHILARVNNKDNIFEAEIDGQWCQIWPPVTVEKSA